MRPVSDPQVASTTPVAEAVSLLVIDDDPEVLAATARILTQAGYDVITGGTAREAIDLTHQHRPAIVLLDIMLPDGSGLEIAQRLKSEPSLASVLVVLLSSFKTSAEDQAWGLSEGLADAYIIRPFSKPEFLARIDALLRLRATQEALREALKEKEALLKETHHRVKNSLALIASLMRIEAGRSREPETKSVLIGMQERIRSVVLLNETLYKTESYTRVNLSKYLREIATHVFQAHGTNSGAVRLALDLEPIEVETSQAIPCGLIVNELLTNSLKHGFPAGRSGEVRVRLHRDPDGRRRLQISDDGPGLPDDFAARQQNSLGLQLVSDLARQLLGKLDVGPAATFTVTFPNRGTDSASIARPRSDP